MAAKKPTAKQIAARKLFAKRAKAGLFKRKIKAAKEANNPFFRKYSSSPSGSFGLSVGYKRRKARVKVSGKRGAGVMEVKAHTKWGLKRKKKRAAKKLKSIFNIGGSA